MPTKDREVKQVTSVAEWKKGSADLQPTPLDLPSGKTCLVQPVGVETFMAEGMIPNSLLPIIQKSIEQGTRGEKVELDKDAIMADLIADTSKVADIFRLADAVTVHCVQQPPISAVPEDGLRDPDVLYVDEVDPEDKMFIMDFAVGGTRDLEQFREQTSGRLASVQSGKGVRKPAKRSGGTRKR